MDQTEFNHSSTQDAADDRGRLIFDSGVTPEFSISMNPLYDQVKLWNITLPGRAASSIERQITDSNSPHVVAGRVTTILAE